VTPANALRLLFILAAVILPSVLIHRVFAEEEGTYRVPQGQGTRGVGRIKHEKLHSKAWQLEAVQTELEGVEAEIDKVEAQILQERLRVPPRAQ
jgi:hypothetical protein